MFRRFTPLKFVDALSFLLNTCVEPQQYLHSSLLGLHSISSPMLVTYIFNSRYFVLALGSFPVISFMYFNLVRFFFQMPSSAWFGRVFHCGTVSQSWSPGSRVGLPRAHPVKRCASAAHSGLICVHVSLLSETTLCFDTSTLNSDAWLLVIIGPIKSDTIKTRM